MEQSPIDDNAIVFHHVGDNYLVVRTNFLFFISSSEVGGCCFYTLSRVREEETQSLSVYTVRSTSTRYVRTRSSTDAEYVEVFQLRYPLLYI
jgi:hypothetical protein